MLSYTKERSLKRGQWLPIAILWRQRILAEVCPHSRYPKVASSDVEFL